MRYFILLLLLFPIIVYAGFAVDGVDSPAAVDSVDSPAAVEGVEGADHCTDTDCSACDYQERWECGSTNGNEENTWTEVGTNSGDWLEDYTSTILAGTESLYADDDEEHCISVSYSAGVYITGMIELNAEEYQYIFVLRDGSDTDRIHFDAKWDTDHFFPKAWYNNKGASTEGSGSWSSGALVYYKVYYKKGGGTDGEVKVWIETDDPFVGWDSSINVTNSTDQFDVAKICVKGDATTNGIIIDDIRVDAADISY